MPGQAKTQGLLDAMRLAYAVKLISGKVEQHNHRRVEGRSDVWNVHLVDFEGSQLGTA